IAAAAEISQSSLNPAGLDSDDLLQLAEKRVAQIAEDRPKEGGLQLVDGLLKATVQRIDELFQSGEDVTGVRSGLTDLDQRTAGWQDGELIILAARPSMGKTALALNFVESAIFTQTNPVLVFSMEMPSTALVMRMMSSVGRIDQGKIDRKSTRLNSSHVKISYAVFCLKKKKIY